MLERQFDHRVQGQYCCGRTLRLCSRHAMVLPSARSVRIHSIALRDPECLLKRAEIVPDLLVSAGNTKVIARVALQELRVLVRFHVPMRALVFGPLFLLTLRWS